MKKLKRIDRSTAYNVIDAIISYEQGELDQEQTLELFQRLVDTGLAWELQGSYGRMAKALLDAGHILPAKVGA